MGWEQQASRQQAGLGRGKSQASAQVQQQSWGLEAPCFLQGELQSVQQPWACEREGLGIWARWRVGTGKEGARKVQRRGLTGKGASEEGPADEGTERLFFPRAHPSAASGPLTSRQCLASSTTPSSSK